MKKWSLLLVGLLYVVGCSEDQRAGGDDFPNTITALKGDVFAGLTANSELEVPQGDNPFDIEEISSQSAARIVVADTNRMPASGGALASADTTIWLEDTLTQGVAIVVIHKQSLLEESTDSIWVLWTDEAKDTLSDNEKIFRFAKYQKNLIGKETFVVVEDLDGDSVIEGTPANLQKSLFIEGRRGDIELRYNELIMGPGLDGVFKDTADNIIYSGMQKYYLNGVLQNMRLFADADGDSILYDGVADSALIWVNDFRNFSGDLTQDTLSWERFKMWRFAEEKKNYAIDFSALQKKVGRWKSTEILDSAGYSSELRDSVWVSEKWVVANDTSKILQRVDYLLYIDPGVSRDIVRFHWQRFDREGVSAFEMIVEPDEPVRETEELTKGDIFLRVSTEKEDFEVEARLESGHLQGKIHEKRKGRRWNLDWNSN